MINLAIVGRTNVGKSSIFNRLSTRKIALVHDQAGVTRDRIENTIKLGGNCIRIVDTPGLETRKKDDILASAWVQTETAIENADIIVFVIDGKAGVNEQEKKLARTLKKNNKPVILVANKTENYSATFSPVAESFSLGFGEPILMAAEHGLGIKDLENVIEEVIEKNDIYGGDDDNEGEEKTDKIRIAILGRPNVGKSTLVNCLAEEERTLTGPIAGITRDPISIKLNKFGREFEIIDTAGMRKKAKVSDELEFVSALKSKQVADKASVVILVIDATLGIEKQDLTIANSIIEEGRVLLLALNKWDSIEDKTKVIEEVKDRISSSLTQVRNISLIPISALHGDGIDKLFKSVLDHYNLWNTRIPTGKLNRFLEEVLEKYPPPMSKTGRRYKIKYITQVKARPPSFVLFSSSSEGLPESYERYLRNELVAKFKLQGVPLRISIKKSKNPYTK